jgi:hypothetical protein
MARRGRMITAALVLFTLFVLITTRRSGSHPRDLKVRLKDGENQVPLHPIIKEPPGKWDPVDDEFRKGHASGEGGIPRDDTRKQDLGDQGINRKSPKKKGPKVVDEADHIKGQPEPEKRPKKEGEGSGAVVTGDDDEQGKVVTREYDPAEGVHVYAPCLPQISKLSLHRHR